jgi:hypothetical protein
MLLLSHLRGLALATTSYSVTSHLRGVALAATICLVTSCGHKEDAPQPQQPIASLTTHTVAVRYQARLVSGASSGLPHYLNLLVEYERVGQTGSASYQLLHPTAQLHDLAVSDTTKEVLLSPIATYPGAIRPKITVSMWEDQQLPALATSPYELTCELILDGRVAAQTTYSVVAGQLPPLVASRQTEVLQ